MLIVSRRPIIRIIHRFQLLIYPPAVSLDGAALGFFRCRGIASEWSILGYTPQVNFTYGTTRLAEIDAQNRYAANMILKNDGEHNYALIPDLTSTLSGLPIPPDFGS
jgi:hypothetical protein